MGDTRPAIPYRPLVGALLALGGAWLGLRLQPGLELGCFARAAAHLAALLAGSPVCATTDGWLLPATCPPVIVSAACSGTDYFLIVATLLGWWFNRGNRPSWLLAPLAIGAAVPLAVAINAVRIATLLQVHHWIIPRLPGAYAPFLHLLAGVAVFLPALIALHLLLAHHGRHRHAPNNS